MQINQMKIHGCCEIKPSILKDNRGVFVKTFNQTVFFENGLIGKFSEEYYSISSKGVLRGLHFQIPPYDYTKLVYCVYGKVLDVLVDLRVGSPTYGKFELFNLSAEKGSVIYIPSGLAHGFYVLSQQAIIIYNVTAVYSPAHDTGIHWNSVGIPWPDKTPLVSKRDEKLVPLADFKSPFKHKK